MNLFGKGPDTRVPKAGRDYWISSMANIADLLGDNGPFGKAGIERQQADYAEQIYRTLNGGPTANYSDAERGITPSGANFGNITADRMIATNNRDIITAMQNAKLNALFNQAGMALNGIQGGSFGGSKGLFGDILSAGATLGAAAIGK